MAIRSSVVALSFLGLAGCAGTFSGDVDGEAPTIMSALYGKVELGDNAHATSVFGFSFMADCERYATWVEEKNDIMFEYLKSDHEDDDIEDAAFALEIADAEFGLPAEGWQVTIAAFTEDELEDDDFDAFGEEVFVSFGHKTELSDYEDVIEDGEDKSVDSYTAIDGQVTFEDVTDDGLRLSTDELVIADSEDAVEDGDDAKELGTGTLSISATHCEAYSKVLDDMFDDLDDDGPPPQDDPADPIDPVDPPEGQVCEISDECPNIACLCDDGSTLGMPVNTRNCIEQECASANASCPSSCESFGFPWTGSVVEPGEEPEQPEDPEAQEGTCPSFIGAGDGCDCGCGTFDTDCSSASATCEFNNCVSGTPDPNNNASCI